MEEDEIVGKEKKKKILPLSKVMVVVKIGKNWGKILLQKIR